MYNILLTSLNVAAIVTIMITKWYLAKGILKPVYWLGILAAVLMTGLNITLYVHDSEQWSIMLLNIINIYTIVMSVVGLRRLKREEKDKCQ